MNQSRRRLLKALCATTAAVTAPRSFGQPPGAMPFERQIAKLANLSKNPALACRLGRSLGYVDRSRDLIASLCQSVLGSQWRRLLNNATRESLVAQLDERRRRDFFDRRVVLLDGWVITQSERDFLILSSMLEDRQSR